MSTKWLQHWNTIHNEEKLEPHSQHETAFAKQVNDLIPPASRILELGCGVANDAVYFAEQGHTVLATDFSDVVIQRNTQKYPMPMLTFRVLDISQPFDLPEQEFDVVYARLSLHYFTDEVTKQIMHEIHRVLSPGGLLCFMCKSVDNPTYGKGILIEKDMYDNDGNKKHFFSEEYARECLNGLFHITTLTSETEELYGKPSADIKVISYKEE